MMNDSLRPTAPDEDWMDGLLRAESRERASDYLSDDGFTGRVLAALPAVSALPAWRKPLVALLWTVVAVGRHWSPCRGSPTMCCAAWRDLSSATACRSPKSRQRSRFWVPATWSALVYAARTD